MRLEIVVDDSIYAIDISDTFMQQAESFFEQIDKAMDRGWQMGRHWIEHPNDIQRCQITANRLLGALNQENHTLAELAAAYILKKFPATKRVDIDTTGNMAETTFEPLPRKNLIRARRNALFGFYQIGKCFALSN